MVKERKGAEKVAYAMWRSFDMVVGTSPRFADTPEKAADVVLAAYASAGMLGEWGEYRNATAQDLTDYAQSHVGDPELREALCQPRFGEYWERVWKCLDIVGCTASELREFVLDFDLTQRCDRFARACVTPESVSALARAVLDVRDGDSVADLGCGWGGFLADAAKAAHIDAYGVDSDRSCALIAAAKLDMLAVSYHVECADAFAAARFCMADKVFANLPVGLRAQRLESSGEYFEGIAGDDGPLGRPASADWLYAKLACDTLAPDGAAAVIVANGATFNGGDMRARRYFVQSGLVRAVVALPKGLFRGVRECSLVVLGHGGDGVRMVDATDLGSDERRRTVLGDGDTAEVVRRLGSDGARSRLVPEDKIARAGYSLYPLRYAESGSDLVNPTLLGDLVESIVRGAALKAADLDRLETDEDTPFRYLRIADIEDGRIGTGMPHLKRLDSGSRRHWLTDGQLVVSKIGSPAYKVAVAEVPEGQTVLAAGNLYLISLDGSRMDPWFAAAYLSSADGQAALGRMAVGTAIPNLALKDLRQVEVPVPPMDVQRSIGAEYRAELERILELRGRLEDARERAAETYARGMRE